MNVGKYLRGEDRHVGTARISEQALGHTHPHPIDKNCHCVVCRPLERPCGCAGCSAYGVQGSVPFEEWLDGWLRAHPEVPTYDKEAMCDAFNAGRALGMAGSQPTDRELHLAQQTITKNTWHLAALRVAFNAKAQPPADAYEWSPQQWCDWMLAHVSGVSSSADQTKT